MYLLAGVIEKNLNSKLCFGVVRSCPYLALVNIDTLQTEFYDNSQNIQLELLQKADILLGDYFCNAAFLVSKTKSFKIYSPDFSKTLKENIDLVKSSQLKTTTLKRSFGMQRRQGRGHGYGYGARNRN